MKRYVGNRLDDDFDSIDEAVAVTRYRMAEQLYGEYVQLCFCGDKNDKTFMIASQIILDTIETILNGNRDVYRRYLQRMESAPKPQQGEK